MKCERFFYLCPGCEIRLIYKLSPSCFPCEDGVSEVGAVFYNCKKCNTDFIETSLKRNKKFCDGDIVRASNKKYVCNKCGHDHTSRYYEDICLRYVIKCWSTMTG